jgi:hypothetical protein
VPLPLRGWEGEEPDAALLRSTLLRMEKERRRPLALRRRTARCEGGVAAASALLLDAMAGSRSLVLGMGL